MLQDTPRRTKTYKTHSRTRTSRTHRIARISSTNKSNYGPASPTTDQDIFSSGFYEQSYYRDLEQIEFSYRGELDYPASTSEATLYSPEDSEYGEAAQCRAAIHRPVVSTAKEAA